MSSSASEPILQDEMQKRRMMKKATTIAPAFQTRIFVLYKDQLQYKVKSNQVKGSISILSIKICEDIMEEAFSRDHVFQVGYLDKGKMFYLYIQAKSSEMREHWKQHIRRLCSTYNDQRMQEKYHSGYYKKSWTCCQNSDKQNVGCTQAYDYNNRPNSPVNRADMCRSPGPSYNNHRAKTPVTMRHMQTNRVKMPSECYDSDDIDERMSSPASDGSDTVLGRANGHECVDRRFRLHSSPLLSCRETRTYQSQHRAMTGTSFKRKQKPRQQSEQDMLSADQIKSLSLHRHTVHDFASAHASRGTIEALHKPSLSSQSLRYQSKPTSALNTQSHSLEHGLSSSTPYNYPIAYSRGASYEEVTKRYYSVSSTSSEAERERLNSTTHSDRFDSLLARPSYYSSTTSDTITERSDSLLGHTSRANSLLVGVGHTRLDSQGSTVYSSTGESSSSSIPRTQSDYQARVDESDLPTVQYTSATITDRSRERRQTGDRQETDRSREREEGELERRGDPPPLHPRRENSPHLRGETRLESGTYVNTHGYSN